MSNDVIPPGGEGEIKATLHPKGVHTEISKNIVVVTNDPAQPRFSLTMKGSLLVDVVAQPRSVSLLNLAPGEPGTGTVSVQLAQGSTATVEAFHIEDTKNFSVREIETEPGSLATYEVRFAGRDEVGTSATNLVLETTGEHTPELTIPVRATAAANLTYPKRVVLIGQDGKYERNIRLSTRRGDPPKVGEVDDPDGLLDIEVLEPTATSVEIALRLREGEATKVDERTVHTLRLHTSDRDLPEIEIQYQFRSARTPTRTKTAKGVQVRKGR